MPRKWPAFLAGQRDRTDRSAIFSHRDGDSAAIFSNLRDVTLLIHFIGWNVLDLRDCVVRNCAACGRATTRRNWRSTASSLALQPTNHMMQRNE